MIYYYYYYYYTHTYMSSDQSWMYGSHLCNEYQRVRCIYRFHKERYVGQHRKHKYHTTLCVKQQPSGNTCDFFVCISMIAFGVQPNCSVSVNAFILFYYQYLLLNIYINLLLIHTSYFIVIGL
jgi:hypothetical protein